MPEDWLVAESHFPASKANVPLLTASSIGVEFLVNPDSQVGMLPGSVQQCCARKGKGARRNSEGPVHRMQIAYWE